MARYSTTQDYYEDNDYTPEEGATYRSSSGIYGSGRYDLEDYDNDMRYGRSGIERNDRNYGRNYNRASSYGGNYGSAGYGSSYGSSDYGYYGSRAGSNTRNYTGSDYGRGSYGSYDEDDYDSNYGRTRNYQNRIFDPYGYRNRGYYGSGGGYRSYNRNYGEGYSYPYPRGSSYDYDYGDD